MKYQEGEVWVLNDGKEYVIMKRLNIGKHQYVMLLTEEEPIEMKLGVIEDDQFKATTNKEEAMYILEAMIHQSK